MFKYLGLLLLSLLTAMPVASNASASGSFNPTNNPVEKVLVDGEDEEDPNVLHGYTYVDDEDSEYGRINRTFDSHELAPIVVREFKAPKGYVFHTEFSDEQAQEVIDQAAFVGASFTYIDPVIYYNYLGARVYANSNPLYCDPNDPFETRRDLMRDAIKAFINAVTLFEVEEASMDAKISIEFELQFPVTTDERDYFFHFYSDELVFEPFNENDFLTIEAHYYQHDDIERRVTIISNPVDGFFYQTPDYNKNGFLTDDTTPWYDFARDAEGWKCRYTITLFAYDTIPIGDCSTYGGVEMSFPEEAMPVRARMRFTAGGVTYTYYSKTIIIGDPHMDMSIDGYTNRASIQRDSEHTFSIEFDQDLAHLSIFDMSLEVTAYPDRLHDAEFENICYSEEELPETGNPNAYYYIPSEDEVPYYQNGTQEEIEHLTAGGRYLIWNQESSEYEDYNGMTIMEYFDDPNDGYDPDEAKRVALTSVTKIPFIGKWRFTIHFYLNTEVGDYALMREDKAIEVVDSEQTQDIIQVDVIDLDGLIRSTIDNEIHLILGGGQIEVIPWMNIVSGGTDNPIYYDWEISKNGVVDVDEYIDGRLVVTPRNAGLLTLTVSAESRLFATVKKTITIHVLELDYSEAKIVVPDEFHYTGKDLTASIDIRGVTNFQNFDVDWKITNKKGDELPEEKVRNNNNGSITILEADYDDYTFTASYNGIEINKLTVQVRYYDLNKFIKINIWWIFLVTIAFVVLVFFLRSLVKKSKTTVENIERVYQVYCQCISNDTLSIEELKRIKREITKCLHRCEDLNIDALNQYEKATRYLRKSLVDTKQLLAKYDTLSPEEKGIMYETLDRDLSKALNVAKEIENAKGLIEQYHASANRHNYETLSKDKTDKNEKK